MSSVPYYDQFDCTNPSLKDAKNLVLLHGWGLHSGLWDGVMPELLQQFNVTVIDLPGMGRSPLPQGEYDLESLSCQVLRVAPDNAIWLGWSLGGLVALKIATDYPGRVAGLVNVASLPAYCKADGWPDAMSPQLLDGFVEMMAEDWEGALIRFLAFQCKDSETYGDDVSQLQEALFFHGQPAQKALRQGLKVLRDTDLRLALQSLSIPSLYLLGQNDNIISSEMAASVAALNDNCSVGIVTGASHAPFLSHPKKCLAALDDFVSEHFVSEPLA
ncbi:MAG: pimeloyl-ACP methyl ester esterase BioH [Pseudomonadales bacterium]|nr:pimeloyl-ACP methyl ester esterase BioH [Pseudomonadales bacterium]